MSFLSSKNKSSIVITGGATGIGFALAKRLVYLGHEVIIASRRLAQLKIAQEEVPELKIIQLDVGVESERIAFHKKIIEQYPQVNVIINNSAVLVATSLADPKPEDWREYKQLLDINVSAPIHLSILFLPHLQTKDNALIINVGSIVGLFTCPSIGVYSASKFALHSFTQSLRHQLKGSKVQVIEVVPPAVTTPANPAETGLDVEIYADDVIEQLLEGRNVEIGYNSDHILRAGREELDGFTAAFNNTNESIGILMPL